MEVFLAACNLLDNILCVYDNEYFLECISYHSLTIKKSASSAKTGLNLERYDAKI